ncbi:hypothetical protein [Desulforegula conservatrix]|uniref:hypothetical protein n=1 Tax=Desulforegula conservatrix TaxID=153026 RepID=UPI0004085B70|nr:hypothetical protein [Desulforegula conservatrix]
MKKKYIYFIAICFVFITATAFAGTIRTGDDSLDESLNSLTEQVEKPEEFIKVNLATRFNQPADKLIGYMNNEKIEVSEVFVISYLAASMGKESDAVMSDFKTSNKNWSQFLKAYKIVKGNKEYRKLLKASINIHPKPFIPKVK